MGENEAAEEIQRECYARALRCSQALSAEGVEADVQLGAIAPTRFSVRVRLAHADDAAIVDEIIDAVSSEIDPTACLPLSERNENNLEYFLSRPRPRSPRLASIVDASSKLDPHFDFRLIAGVDASGDSVHALDLRRNPTVLVAGLTAATPVSYLWSLLLQLLTRRSSQELRVLLVTPEAHDFDLASRAPHLFDKPVTTMEQADALLTRLQAECDARAALLGAIPALAIEDIALNAAHGEASRPPQLCVFVSDLSHLRMHYQDRVDRLIERISAEGSRLGIYLVCGLMRAGEDLDELARRFRWVATHQTPSAGKALVHASAERLNTTLELIVYHDRWISTVVAPFVDHDDIRQACLELGTHEPAACWLTNPNSLAVRPATPSAPKAAPMAVSDLRSAVQALLIEVRKVWTHAVIRAGFSPRRFTQSHFDRLARYGFSAAVTAFLLFAVTGLAGDVLRAGEPRAIQFEDVPDPREASSTLYGYTDPNEFGDNVDPLHPARALDNSFTRVAAQGFYQLHRFTDGPLPIDSVESSAPGFERQIGTLAERLPANLSGRDVIVAFSDLGINVAPQTAVEAGLVDDTAEAIHGALLARYGPLFEEVTNFNPRTDHRDNLRESMTRYYDFIDGARCEQFAAFVEEIARRKRSSAGRLPLPDSLIYFMTFYRPADCNGSASRHAQAVEALPANIYKFNGSAPLNGGGEGARVLSGQIGVYMSVEDYRRAAANHWIAPCAPQTNPEDTYIRGLHALHSLAFERADVCFSMLSQSRDPVASSLGAFLRARAAFWRNRFHFGDYEPDDSHYGSEVTLRDLESLDGEEPEEEEEPIARFAASEANAEDAPVPCAQIPSDYDASSYATCLVATMTRRDASRAAILADDRRTRTLIQRALDTVQQNALISPEDLERYIRVLSSELENG